VWKETGVPIKKICVGKQVIIIITAMRIEHRSGWLETYSPGTDLGICEQGV